MMNSWIVPLLVALALLLTVPVGLRTLGLATPPAAVSAARALAAASFVLPRGAVAGSAAAMWLLAAGWLVVQHRHLPWATLLPLMWLPAGAAWLVAARCGLRPLGFSDAIVLLTAAHFHHAGFGVSALLATVRARRGLVVHQFGMLAVAAGISGVDALAPVGATLIVVALVCWSLAAWRLRPVLRGWRRAALTVAALAWTYPMLLAVSWAMAPFLPHLATRTLARTLTAMAAQHGTVNALAVVLLGLVALRPSTAPAPVPAPPAQVTLPEWSPSC